jgi:hypothetical protein
MLASAPLATGPQVAEFNQWVATVPDAHIREWKSQPGNFQLMTKQGVPSRALGQSNIHDQCGPDL